MKIEKLDVVVVLTFLALVGVYLRLENIVFLYAGLVVLVPWIFFFAKDNMPSKKERIEEKK
jgi:hypothetical protein